MSTPGKLPPSRMICWKWPWHAVDSPAQTSSGASPCDAFRLPWLLRPLQTLGSSLAANLFGIAAAPRPAALGNQRTNHQASLKMEARVIGASGARVAQPLSKEEQGEAEQRAFAAALASQKEATVLEFYSPRCRLCSSLLDLVLEVERRNSNWVSFALADAENEKWLPEVVHYDIKYVPCFVLLDKHGIALAKTGAPTGRHHVIAGLSHLLNLKRPQGRGSDGQL